MRSSSMMRWISARAFSFPAVPVQQGELQAEPQGGVLSVRKRGVGLDDQGDRRDGEQQGACLRIERAARDRALRGGIDVGAGLGRRVDVQPEREIEGVRVGDARDSEGAIEASAPHEQLQGNARGAHRGVGLRDRRRRLGELQLPRDEDALRGIAGPHARGVGREEFADHAGFVVRQIAPILRDDEVEVRRTGREPKLPLEVAGVGDGRAETGPGGADALGTHWANIERCGEDVLIRHLRRDSGRRIRQRARDTGLRASGIHAQPRNPDVRIRLEDGSNDVAVRGIGLGACGRGHHRQHTSEPASG